MYRERLLGPSMLLNHSSTSVDFVEMLAGNKINAKIDQTTGKFETDDMQKFGVNLWRSSIWLIVPIQIIL